ncbi:MAG TPA: carbohydrate kinase family protein, partial [Gemmatales bacterium]|nr:carbohydrate kinase family protein [Gemmatales bacterium]
MKSVDVICAGIVVADHICTPISHVPRAGELVLADGMTLASGGCAANTAVDLVKFNVSTHIVGRVGDDLFGNLVIEMLQDQGIETSGLLRTTGIDTSQTLIINVKNEDRRFVHTFGANAEFRTADIPRESVAQCKILYVGGYLLMPAFEQDGLVELFEFARSHHVKTVLDVGIPRPESYLERLEKVLP